MAIIFKEDFIKYGATVQWNTKNLSFIRIAGVLKRMGIENYYFPLALVQRELESVDPFSDGLTPLQIQKILYECKINYWYFLRECVRVPSAGGDGIPYLLNRANLAASYAYLNDIDYFQIQPRQTGKTMGTQVIMAYHLFIAADHIDVGMYTKDSNLVQDNVARLKELRDNLPWYMVSKSKDDWDRKEGISYAARKNYYKTFPGPNDERAAVKLGRGSTFEMMHVDEIAFLKYNNIVISSAVPAMNAAAAAGRKAGLPAPIIYTTTAGDPATPEGLYALAIASNGMDFTEHLYDCKNTEEVKKIVKEHSQNNLLYLEYSYKQLGYTDEWFEYNSKRSNSSTDQIARDFLNIWKSSSDRTIIPPDLLDKISASGKSECFLEIDDAFITKYYLDQSIVESNAFRNRPLIAGMDSSENVGHDFTVITMIDPADMSIVAVSRGNTANIMAVSRYVVKMLTTYKNLVFIPESKSTGVVIVDYAVEELQSKNINPYFRIFNMAIQERDNEKYRNVNIYDYHDIHGANKAMFGYKTGAAGGSTSRNMLYKETMMKTLQMNHSRIYDKTLIRELASLEERNGRVDHPKNLHDDTVISYLLACWLVFFGKNLSMYGLTSDYLLSTIKTDSGKTVNRATQLKYLKRIKELEKEISNCSNSTLKDCYTRELKAINGMIDVKLLETAPIAITQVEHERNETGSKGIDVNALRRFAYRR